MEGQTNIHPYFPKDLYLPDFTPNFLSSLTIVTYFAAAPVIVFTLTWILSGLYSKASKAERLVMCWLTYNGLVHLTLELYLVFRPYFYQDKTGNIFAEIWKEYSKGDSRYLSHDSTIIALEGLSIFISGPTHLLAAYAVATDKCSKNVLQLVASLGELYLAVIFLTTPFIEGKQYSASPLYFYGYFVVANSPWVVIPLLIIIRSWKKICEVEGTNKRKVQ
ncbi:probable 3-beta-hydroxysteroid-Delta(8),Delta(7)-isomerase [Beta vulgaris subsp. vulgaris]|uniref:probable 3-beta-hydroxysteroid-Delta(8),Delta(7)-isomerase n=1 Tax=Beta vulgaris subsp. vulgaris TaxID=3555 RepID=UPI002036FEB0|nr:probable 3-beta-hydroxysteroid-Delta(8),Delta(7)-isomerase [Beta vulgaris subsp. vulgaris]